MQPPPPDIADAHDGFPGELALNGEIPAPGFRISEILGLGCDDERNRGRATCAWVICRAIGYAGVGLEGRIAAQEDGVTYPKAGDKPAGTGANDGFWSELVGDTSAG